RYTCDLNKAREKLREGGKPKGFKFTMYTKISPIDVQVAQVMQAQLKRVGIETKIVQLEGALHLKVMLEKTYEGNYGLWSGYPEPDTNLYRQFHPKGSANWTGYADPRVTELLDKARESLNHAERKRYYSEALDIIIRDAPQIFVYYYPRRAGVSAKVQNFVLYPDGKLRFKTVWLSR
ncbi:MAG: ABC transporter substrate-binding protein, partial [Deltaproteobacteria bacterium]|nr:ABC transporter substrate-binding protein [Deltaproteobacteria bacterium]